MSWIILAVILIIISIIYACIVLRISNEIRKSAGDVIAKANRLMEDMDSTESDIWEIRQQIRALSNTLDEVEDLIDEEFDIETKSETDDEMDE